jgi:hypothetical protein
MTATDNPKIGSKHGHRSGRDDHADRPWRGRTAIRPSDAASTIGI